MLKSYFKKIFEVNKTGDAREESYYSTLEDLLKTYGDSIEKKNFHITTLPKKPKPAIPTLEYGMGNNTSSVILKPKPLQ